MPYCDSCGNAANSEAVVRCGRELCEDCFCACNQCLREAKRNEEFDNSRPN
jgi:hypothetical protein